MEKTLVSIVVITYYHENYIRQALDSIFGQNVDFVYEVIVADDCSKDKTRDIILEYKAKCPDLIKCLFNENNLGIPANLYNALCNCNGKYITFLSGDDYWLGEDILKKKIDFLEKNAGYYAVCTRIDARLEGVKSIWISPESKDCDKELTMEMYLRGIPFHTHGFVLRNEMITDEGKDYFSLIPKCSKYIDDSTMCLLVLNRGKVYLMDVVGYAYRIEKKSNKTHSFNSTNTILTTSKKQIDLYNNFHQYLPEIDLFNLYQRCLAVAIPGAFIYRSVDMLKDIIRSIPDEYKRRGVVIKSTPLAIKKCLLGVVKSIKRR